MDGGGVSASAGTTPAGSAAAASVAAKAAVPLLAKAIAILLAAVALIVGAAILITGRDGGAADGTPYGSHTPSEPSATGTDGGLGAGDGEEQESALTSPDTASAPEEDGTPIPSPSTAPSFHDSLSEGQRLLLSRLVAALREADYLAAYAVMEDDGMAVIYGLIPANGWGSREAWYSPDADTGVRLWAGDGGDSASIYVGDGDDGYYCNYWHGREEDGLYTMYMAHYSGGQANGPFMQSYENLSQGLPGWHERWGELRGGEPFGPIKYVGDGVEGVWEDYDPEWFALRADWPDW